MSEENNKILLRRLRQEQYDLIQKICRLKSFIGSETWEKLDSMDAKLLDIQLNAMNTYEEILSTRIMKLIMEVK